VQGTLTPPAPRELIAVHLAWALPLVALALWFGVVDTPAIGEGRCASCGVEGYVIAAHLVAALWLAGVVAWTAAARRRLTEGIAAPGHVTLAGLGVVAVVVLASLAWHPLLNVPAFAAMIASIALFPALAVLWVVQLVLWTRRPPASEDELAKRLRGELAMAWVGLVVLLPAMFGWVWADRVDWLVF